MRPEPARKLPPFTIACLGLILIAGCARERHEITPTTLGTDFRQVPRGTMRAPAWPGTDLAKASPRTGGPTSDPGASMASGSIEAR